MNRTPGLLSRELPRQSHRWPDLASDKTPATLRTIKNEQDFPSGFQYVYTAWKSFLGKTEFYD